MDSFAKFRSPPVPDGRPAAAPSTPTVLPVWVVAVLVLALGAALSFAYGAHEQRELRRSHRLGVEMEAAALGEQLKLQWRVLNIVMFDLMAHEREHDLSDPYSPDFRQHREALDLLGLPLTALGKLELDAGQWRMRQWRREDSDSFHSATLVDARQAAYREAASEAVGTGRMAIAGLTTAGAPRRLVAAWPIDDRRAVFVAIDPGRWFGRGQAVEGLALRLSLFATGQLPAVLFESPDYPAQGESFGSVDLVPGDDIRGDALHLDYVVRPPDLSPAHHARWVGLALSAVVAALCALALERVRRVERRAEQVAGALLDSRQRLERAIEATREGLWEYDGARRGFSGSARCGEIVCLPPGGLTARKLLHCVLLADRPALFAALRQCYAGAIMDHDCRIALPDGRLRWVRVRGRYSEQAGGGLLAGALADVTREQEAQLRLEQSQDFLSRVLDAVPVALAVKDRSQRVLIANRRLLQLIDRRAQELTGRRMSSVFGNALSLHLEELEREAFESGRAQSHSDWAETAEGRRYLRIDETVGMGPKGEPVVISTLSDLTPLQEREQEQERFRDFLNRVIDVIPHPIYVKDAQLRFLLVNRAGREEVGRAMGSLPPLLGRTLSQVLGNAYAVEREQGDLRLLQGQLETEEALQLSDPQGRVRYYQLRRAACRDPSGQPVVVGVGVDLTDLHLSQLRWRYVLEGAGEGVWEYDLRTGRVEVSESWKAVHGYAGEPVEYRIGDIGSWLHPDDVALAQTALSDLLAGRSAVLDFEARAPHKQRGWIWVRARGYVVERDAAGAALRVVGSTVDISAAKQAVLALRQSEACLQFALESTGQAVLDWAPQKAQTNFSPQWRQFLGLAPDVQMDLAQLYQAVFPQQRSEVEAALQHLAHGTESELRLECRLQRGDGDALWAAVSGRVMEREFDAAGHSVVSRVILVFADVSARKSAEARWECALVGGGTGVFDWDVLRGCMYLSAQWYAMLGLPGPAREEQVEALAALIHPDDRELILQRVRSHLRGETPSFECEHRLRNASGAWTWMLARGRAMERGADGRVVRMVGTVTDISAQKATEAALRQSQARWRFALEGAGDGVWDIDFAHAQAYRSRRWYEMLGYEPGEVGLSARAWLDLVHPEDRDRVSQAYTSFVSAVSRTVLCEHRIRCRDGSYRWVLQRGRIIEVGEDGRALRAVGTQSDVHAAKTAEEQLRLHHDHLRELVAAQTADLHAAKRAAEQALEAKSQFLANMSHELRTPMHAILSFARIGYARAQAEPERVRGYFDRIRLSGERLLVLLNDLLDLSRLQAGRRHFEFVATDLARLLDDSVSEFEALAESRHIQMHIVCEPGASLVWGDPVALRQVLDNLLGNALKFSFEGGKVELQLRAAQLVGVPAAVELVVSDHGPGIPETELESIFDHFVQSSRTRTDAGGTGLGLAICREITRAHRGQIFARNAQQGGAELVLRLPATTGVSL